ncbi:MAG: hypothetical protein AVDCRST_MAG01-01-4868, partial [uncultured Rubrobacteraceae bacterium]
WTSRSPRWRRRPPARCAADPLVESTVGTPVRSPTYLGTVRPSSSAPGCAASSTTRPPARGRSSASGCPRWRPTPLKRAGSTGRSCSWPSSWAAGPALAWPRSWVCWSPATPCSALLRTAPQA